MIWTLNVFFLLCFSYFVADIINLFIGQQLTLPASRPAIEIPTTMEAQIRPPTEIYTSIVERNIFGIQPSASMGPLGAQVSGPVMLSPLRVRLIGTIVGSPEFSMAVIEDLATREQRLYRLEDIVQADARLVEITRNEVTFLRGLIREKLFIEQEITAARSVGQPRPKAPSPARPATSQNKWILDKRMVTSALENLPQLLTKARIVPHLSSDGKNNGFRVVSIKPASFYERIGLRNGDVIQRINGIEVKDPVTFMQVFTQLKNETTITLDLLRNNRKESFTYDIR